MHFHIIPAPKANEERRSGWASNLGRDELDDDEAGALATRLREAIAKDAAGESGPDRRGQVKAKL